MRLFYSFLLVIVLTGCSLSNDKPETESQYADYINFGGKHYVQAWELALVDTAGITEIGEVESGYVISQGSPIYEIAGYPEHNVVAVNAERNNAGLVTNVTGYLVYVQHGEDGKSHYPKIHDQFQQIKIYQGSELWRELNGEDVRAFLELFNQQGPPNEFHFEKGPEYTVLFVADHPLGLNYGIMEKEGRFGLAHTESRLPDEIARYFEESA